MTKLVTASVGHFNGKPDNTLQATCENLSVLFELPTGKYLLREYIASPVRERLNINPTTCGSYYSSPRSFLSGKTGLISIASRCNLTSRLFKAVPNPKIMTIRTDRCLRFSL